MCTCTNKHCKYDDYHDKIVAERTGRLSYFDKKKISCVIISLTNMFHCHVYNIVLNVK